jgi:hypothetical protein
MRTGFNMSIQERSLLGVQKMKRAKINFFDPQWQSIQGSKRKKVKKTKIQINSCKKVGFNNKKYVLNITLTKTTVWRYFVKSKNILYIKKLNHNKVFKKLFVFYKIFPIVII